MQANLPLLTQVVRHFNLVYPVTVAACDGLPDSYGRYAGVVPSTKPMDRTLFVQRASWPRHGIYLGDDLTPWEASLTVIHELTHANQNERSLMVRPQTKEAADYLGRQMNRKFGRLYNFVMRGTTVDDIGTVNSSSFLSNYVNNPFEYEAHEVSHRLRSQLPEPLFYDTNS